MKIYLKHLIWIFAFLFSCSNGSSQQKDQIFSPLATYSKHYKEVHYGTDSVYYYGIKDSILEKIIYRSDITVGKPIIKTFYPTGETEKIIYQTDSTLFGEMRYQLFFKSGEISQVGYTRRNDSLFINEPETFKRTDSVISYSKDGLTTRIGTKTYVNRKSYLMEKHSWDYYSGVWRTYNADGILIEEDIPLDGEGYGNPQKAYKSYYTNGQLKEYAVQGDMYAGGVSLEYIRYDSLGNKLEHATFEHLYPEWGQSYNDTFSVSTIKEYYPNGKVKTFKKEKAYSQSEAYKCGKWIYYDGKGNIKRTETYGDCYNFELEEEYRVDYD